MKYKKVGLAILLFILLSVSLTQTTFGANAFYETIKDNVPVWKEASSYSEKLTTLAKAGTRVTIVSISKNSAGNDWGKTDKGTYIFMGNLKPYIYTITFTSVKNVDAFYETIKADVPVWNGPSAYSTRNSTLATQGSRVKIVQTGLNESGNDWGKTDKGTYIFMGNLKPYVYTITFNSVKNVDAFYETVKADVPVWNGPSAYSKQNSTLAAQGSRVKIVQTGINESGNDWGKTDKGTYIFMGNLKPYVYTITFNSVKNVDAFYETVKADVPVWNGPSAYSTQNSILAAQGSRVKIVQTGINESGNDWGKTDKGTYIFMGNLKPYLHVTTFVDVKPVNDYYETVKDQVPVWNSPSAYATQHSTIATLGTKVKILEMGKNESGNDWGKTDQNLYIFMGNLKLSNRQGEFVNIQPGKQKFTTLIDNVPLRSGPTTSAGVIKTIAKAGTPLIITSTQINGYGNEWGITNEGLYVYMANVQADITVFIDGKQLQLDSSPFIKNGRVLVPVASLSEALGANVTWDNNANSVIIQRGIQTIVIKIGSSIAKSDETLNLEVPAQIINGVTYLPIKSIVDIFGIGVAWNGEERRVDITGANFSNSRILQEFAYTGFVQFYQTDAFIKALPKYDLVSGLSIVVANMDDMTRQIANEAKHLLSNIFVIKSYREKNPVMTYKNEVVDAALLDVLRSAEKSKELSSKSMNFEFASAAYDLLTTVASTSEESLYALYSQKSGVMVDLLKDLPPTQLDYLTRFNKITSKIGFVVDVFSTSKDVFLIWAEDYTTNVDYLNTIIKTSSTADKKIVYSSKKLKQYYENRLESSITEIKKLGYKIGISAGYASTPVTAVLKAATVSIESVSALVGIKNYADNIEYAVGMSQVCNALVLNYQDYYYELVNVNGQIKSSTTVSQWSTLVNAFDLAKIATLKQYDVLISLTKDNIEKTYLTHQKDLIKRIYITEKLSDARNAIFYMK